MPVMDEFRRRWPEVEVDLVAGFHSDPLALLSEGRADLVIGSAPAKRRPYAVRRCSASKSCSCCPTSTGCAASASWKPPT